MAILDMPSRCATRIYAAFSVPDLTLYRSTGSGDLYISMQSKHDVLIDRSADGLDATDALRPLQKHKKLTH
jgi:hypothetical protein